MILMVNVSFYISSLVYLKSEFDLADVIRGGLSPRVLHQQEFTRNEDRGLFKIIIRGSVGPEDDNLKLPEIRVLRGTLYKLKEDFKFTRLLMFCSTSQEVLQTSTVLWLHRSLK